MPNVLDGANKQGLIVFGGERSDNYGMVVSAPPSFERARRKQTIFSVPGRSGNVVFQEDAWEDVPRTYDVFIDENIQEDSGGNIVSGTLSERVNNFEAMLNSKNGYQRLTDNFEPDYYRLALYSGGDTFTNELLTVGRATLNFTCNPKRFLVSGETGIVVANGDTLANPTRFASKPLIKIEATNKTVSVAINGKTITAEVADYIYIDCDKMNAYRLATENRNDKVSGDLQTFAIPSGSSTIGITGSPTKVTITPNWFTI